LRRAAEAVDAGGDRSLDALGDLEVDEFGVLQQLEVVGFLIHRADAALFELAQHFERDERVAGGPRFQEINEACGDADVGVGGVGSRANELPQLRFRERTERQRRARSGGHRRRSLSAREPLRAQPCRGGSSSSGGGRRRRRWSRFLLLTTTPPPPSRTAFYYRYYSPAPLRPEPQRPSHLGVRTGSHKLLFFDGLLCTHPAPFELYDLAADTDETRNVYDSAEPELSRRLRRKLVDVMREAGDTVRGQVRGDNLPKTSRCALLTDNCLAHVARLYSQMANATSVSELPRGYGKCRPDLLHARTSDDGDRRSKRLTTVSSSSSSSRRSSSRRRRRRPPRSSTTTRFGSLFGGGGSSSSSAAAVATTTRRSSSKKRKPRLGGL